MNLSKYNKSQKEPRQNRIHFLKINGQPPNHDKPPNSIFVIMLSVYNIPFGKRRATFAVFFHRRRGAVGISIIPAAVK